MNHTGGGQGAVLASRRRIVDSENTNNGVTQMFALLVIYKGKATLNDECPLAWSMGLVRSWARQRLEAGVTVEVVNKTTGAIVFTETCN